MRIEDTVAYPEGALTLAEATRALQEGEQALARGVTVFDLAGVTKVDSSALSLLLSWQRRAQARSQPLSFRNLPESVHSLAGLYGLADLIH
ncbi:STAS domain-containing protein [Parasulfuritortus cantonensis]|uniref:STAS domain-containing protein n=1 Tax=Parasulfuritortus cantonensis TaxID=2528202 RepID=A0A4R1BMI9_9PROT|nr:STAS domain-containing protein [Parasulfuritortus cantonensis]TCJ18528.1 STAS domain-containing protein [Parasulfuritortus cantonensis]